MWRDKMGKRQPQNVTSWWGQLWEKKGIALYTYSSRKFILFGPYITSRKLSFCFWTILFQPYGACFTCIQNHALVFEDDGDWDQKVGQQRIQLLMGPGGQGNGK